MIHLRLRTEYSYRRAFGKVDAVLDVLGPVSAAGIADTGTWGHVAWVKACKKRNIRPLLGVELVVVPDARVRERQPSASMVLLARTDAGLREMYEVVSLAHTLFYYTPRLDYRDINAISNEVVLIAGPNMSLERLTNRPNVYLEMTPGSLTWNKTVARMKGWQRVVTCDNYFPRVDDRRAYEILTGKDRQSRTTPMHIMTEDELWATIPEATDDDFLNTERIAGECTATLPQAEMVRWHRSATLRELCERGAVSRGVDLGSNPIYRERLDRELQLIAEKQFEDYFFVISDMVAYAKQHMLVGPARGSSAGSVVCYFLGITDVDPILHDTMFERFIDVTRNDLPDIDIDFQDNRREIVIDYLKRKYGEERVGRIGTVSRYKAKSCLNDVAKELGIPHRELRDVSDAIIERSSGDARAQFCIADTFESLEVAKKLLEKYPALRIASELEGHAQHTGKHAAGIIVSEHPLTRYCSIAQEGVAQIDKKDAESLNMLKIDVLGLRTLAVIQDTLDQIGKTRDWLVTYPLDDEKAFEVFNEERYSGIFQFEGYALQSLCRQMKVRSFTDIAAIGALARPGPLHCGAASEYVNRRIGKDPIVHMHSAVEPITTETYGVVIYQEQVMAIGREVGDLSWEDVNQLRRAMSKSLGDEFFNRYWDKFRDGARGKGIAESDARRIWEKMCTFGSWAFNKSHGISYGLISYWCAVLKAHWPLEYAAACLRNEKNPEQGVLILRELVKEGFKYRSVDPERSGMGWSVIDGMLVGGLINIKGVGAKKAEDILKRRAEGRPLLPNQRKLLTEGSTPYDDIFEADRRFGDIYDNPKKHNVLSGGISLLAAMNDPGEYVFIARLREKNLRDMNEYQSLVKRGGRHIKRFPLFLNLVLEDDTGTIIGRVGRFDYPKWGKPIVEAGKLGDWYLFKGVINNDGWRVVNINKWRKLDQDYPRITEEAPSCVSAPAPSSMATMASSGTGSP